MDSAVSDRRVFGLSPKCSLALLRSTDASTRRAATMARCAATVVSRAITTYWRVATASHGLVTPCPMEVFTQFQVVAAV
jgi:hypothetical protein